MTRMTRHGGPEHRRRSPLTLILFAILVVVVGHCVGRAQGIPVTMQLDAVIGLPAQMRPAAAHDGTEPPRRTAAADASKPHRIELQATLANLDGDVESDGWQIRLVVIDRHHRAVITPGRVTITLSPNAIDRFGRPVRQSEVTLQSWSMPLSPAADGVMIADLPARGSLATLIRSDQNRSTRAAGTGGFVTEQTFVPAAVRDRYQRATGPTTRTISRSRFSQAIASPIDPYVRDGYPRADENLTPWQQVENAIRRRDRWEHTASRLPQFGTLRVRVQVPGHGVLESQTDVPIQTPIAATDGRFWFVP